MDTVFLVQKAVELNEVEITVKKLEEVVKDKRFYVDDYLVLPNFDFLIITYKINIKGFEVSYYKKDRGITCSKRIKDEFNEHLFKDCFNNFHLVTHACSRQFYFNTDSTFEFLPAYRKSKFDSTLSKVIVRIDSQFIYKNDNPSKTFTGTYFNTTSFSSFLTYTSLYNKHRSELYTVVYDKDIRTMIESEMADSKRNQAAVQAIDGKASSNQSREASSKFFLENIVGPIYAPMFKKNDTLIVLNFQEDIIVFLSRYGEVLKTVKIQDFSKYRHFQAYYDEVKQLFYINVTENFDTHLVKRLNIYTGKFDRIIHLERPFPKNIQIIDNRMYYQVKEHEWDDTSYIYMQNL